MRRSSIDGWGQKERALSAPLLPLLVAHLGSLHPPLCCQPIPSEPKVWIEGYNPAEASYTGYGTIHQGIWTCLVHTIFRKQRNERCAPTGTVSSFQHCRELDKNTMASTAYTYRPLRNEAGIRVLLLEPASTHGAPLFVSIQHIQIMQHSEGDGFYKNPRAAISTSSVLNTSQVEFEAISYAWGTAPFTESLGVHRSKPPTHFMISPTVDLMLRYLRLPKKKRTVWIDALCINQNDLGEKAAQVNFMGEIYRQAKGIVVWLGPPMNTQDNVLQFFQHLVKYGQEDSEDSEQRVDTWDKLRQFLERSWFTRRWTIQEAVLGKQVVMLCGKDMINFMVFAKHACLLAQDQSYVKVRLAGAIRKLRMMYELRAAIAAHAQIDPLSMFVDFSTAECTNERDRIFALNALTSMRVPVSYTDSVEEIFLAYAKRHVDIENYAILNAAAAFRSTKSALPSWVPDWQYLPVYTPLATDLVLPKPEDQMMKYEDVAEAQGISDGATLTITGVQFGIVSHTGAKAPMPVFGGDLLRLLKDWYTIFESYPNSTERSPPFTDALARQFISTLTLGTVVKRSNALGPDHPWLHDAYSEDVPGVSSILAHLVREERSLQSATDSVEVPTNETDVAELMECLANSNLESHPHTNPFEVPSGLNDTLKYLTYTPSSLLPNLHYDKKSIWGSVKHSLADEGDYGQNLEPKEVVEILCRAVAGRTCFWSSDGSFGLGPAHMEVGDLIVAVPDCPSLYVLRPKAKDATEYVLVGDCYVHDFKPEDVGQGERSQEQFCIV
jgi:hypothetical protein